MAGFSGPCMSNFGRAGSWTKGSRFVGDMIPFLLILGDTNPACIGPESSFVIEDGKMSQVEEQSFEFEGFFSFVIKIDGYDDIVIGPVFRVEVSASACAQGVTGFALRAVAMPGLAEGVGGDAGELS